MKNSLLLFLLLGLAAANFQGRALQQIQRRTDWDNIRISVNYVNPSSPSDRLTTIQEVVNASVQYYQNALKVHRVDGKLVMSGFNKCFEAEIPAEHKTEGVQADFILYVTVSDEAAISNSWGNYCAYDSATNQPTAGQVHINTSNFSTVSKEKYMAYAAQSIGHTLGFNSQLFSSWAYSGDVTAQVTIRGKAVTLLTTSNVVTKARAHFGCQTLNGVELEDGGGIGIEGTMWEARIMNGDFMSSILDSDHIVYSDITLAAFKDMGWYDVDYTYSQQLTWGKDAGCDFVNSGCINSNQPANYHFCATMQTVGTTSCDYKRVNKGICNLIDYGSDLESQYRHFSDASQGGAIEELDFCPVVEPLSENASCLVSGTTGDANYGESFGATSRCFEGTYVVVAQDGQTQAASVQHSGCHQVNCQGNEVYTVTVGNTVVECTTPGSVSVEGYLGSITCASYKEVCYQLPCPNACYGVGTCNNGVCSCDSGDSTCEQALKDALEEDDDFANYLGAFITFILVF